MKNIHLSNRFIWFLVCFQIFTVSVFGQAPLKMAIISEETHYSVNTDMGFLAQGQYFFWIFSDSTEIASISESATNPLGQWSLYSAPRFREAFDTFDCYTRYLVASNEDEAEDTGLVSRGGVLPIGSTAVKEPIRARGGLDHLDISFFKWDGKSSPYWDSAFVPSEWKKGKWILLVSLKTGIRSTNTMLRFKTRSKKFVSPCWYSGPTKKTFSAWELFTLDPKHTLSLKNTTYLSKQPVIPVPLSVIKRRQEFLDILRVEFSRQLPVITYSWDIGSLSKYKCEYCTSAPPRFEEIAQLQFNPDGIPEHYYFTRTEGKIPESWSLSTQPFISYQLLFEGTNASKGFLDCPQKKEYLQGVVKREQQELASLESLIGKNKALIFNRKEE